MNVIALDGGVKRSAHGTCAAISRANEKKAREQATEMLDAFASVGASGFELTKIDLDGKKLKHEGKPRSLENLRRTIGASLETASKERCRIIIRPHGSRFRLVQLDDLDADRLEIVKNLCFIGICTSPRNFQAWVAVSDAPSDPDAAQAQDRRLKIGTGADKRASGATIIAGCDNFKRKYGPDFPRVHVVAVNASRTTTFAALDAAGLLGTVPAPPPCFSSSSRSRSEIRPTAWPDYAKALAGAPRKADGTPDRSAADFHWCVVAADWGWSLAETAANLSVVSAKAQKKGPLYCKRTAEKAFDVRERA